MAHIEAKKKLSYFSQFLTNQARSIHIGHHLLLAIHLWSYFSKIDRFSKTRQSIEVKRTVNLIVRSYDVVLGSSFLSTAHSPPKVCTKVTSKQSTQISEINVTATETCVKGAICKQRPPQKCQSRWYTNCGYSGWIWCAILDNLQLLEAISVTQNQSERHHGKSGQLPWILCQYHVYHGSKPQFMVTNHSVFMK